MSINYEDLSIAFSVVNGLAVIITFFRLGLRLRLQRFWWEDVWAAVASLCTVVVICSLVVIAKSVHFESVLAGKVRAYMFASVTWSVRMSLIFSIIRITSSTVLRRILLFTAACFIVFWAVTFGLLSWWFAGTTTIILGAGPTCMLPASVSILEAAMNVVADLVTVLFSIKLLWRVKLPRRQRRMILYLFSSSVYLCMVSLALAISQFVSSKSAEVQEIITFVQVTVFMIVCNLVVVVTFIYRIFWISRDNDSPPKSGSCPYDDDFTTPLPRTQNLTTVDLESVHTSELENSCSHSIAHSTISQSLRGSGEGGHHFLVPFLARHNELQGLH